MEAHSPQKDYGSLYEERYYTGITDGYDLECKKYFVVNAI
jgi:hypothetical protein